MGLCPDCKSEGETISYVGASRADIVDSVEPNDESADGDEEEPEKVEVCDLCEEEYIFEE